MQNRMTGSGAVIHRPTAATGPIECQPWCVYPNGHYPAAFVEDQWCRTEELLVPVSLQSDADCDERDNSVLVYGAISPVDPLHVVIAHDSTRSLPHFSMRLTPGEAHQLVEAVQLVLGQIETVR